jgi:hypothetical protein
MRRLGSLLIVTLSLMWTVAGTAAPHPTRHLLANEFRRYPRLVRLQYSGPANGTILADSDTVRDGVSMGVIEASTDGGRTFHPRATIPDPVAAGGHLCCTTLFELPSAVGRLPAGSLLWADTARHNELFTIQRVEQRLWASTDHGAHWRFLSTIATADSLFGTWEPSLSVAADGQLVAFYSDETDHFQHSQKIVQARSPDGVTWVDRTDTVVSDDQQVRPGMANVIRLPDGSYFMTYEVCDSDFVHWCLAYFRRSARGWDFGDPRDLGTPVRTGDGKYAVHTPYPVWSPGPEPAGTILLTSQMVALPGGGIAPESGTVLFANGSLGAGGWREIPAPVTVRVNTNDPCQNYSSAVLPNPGGTAALEAATDLDGGVCRGYLGSERLR